MTTPTGKKDKRESRLAAISKMIAGLRQALDMQRQSLDAIEALVAELRAEHSPPSSVRGRRSEWVSARDSGLGVHTFRRAGKRGRFPIHRVGRRLLARRRDVNRFIEQHRVAPKQPARDTPDPFDDALANGALTTDRERE